MAVSDTEILDPFDMAFGEATAVTTDDPTEAEKEAAEKAEAEKVAAEKAAAEKTEAEKAAAEKTEAEKAAAEKVAAEKAEADRLAADPLAVAQAETDRLKKELEETKKKAAEVKTPEPSAEEKAATEKKQKDREETEKKNEEEWAGFKKDWAEPAAMMEKMYSAIMSQVQGMIQQAVAEAVGPLVSATAQTAEEKFIAKVQESHSDGFDLLKAGEVDKWIETLPAFQKAGANKILDEGDPSSVVELLDAFKVATGRSKDTKTADELAAEAATRLKSDQDKERKLRGLAVVPDKRTVVTGNPDPNDFDGAFAQAMALAK